MSCMGAWRVTYISAGDSLDDQEYVHNDDCDADDDEDDNEVDNNDDSGIAITIPMLGWDLDTADYGRLKSTAE